MKKHLVCILLLLISFFKGCSCDVDHTKEADPRPAVESVIAVWAFPDSAPVSGTVNIGVVAYYSGGVPRVDFSCDAGHEAAITEETINPDTAEYEFVYSLDTTVLTDGEHTIIANATGNELPPLTIFVANSAAHSTWHVDGAAPDDSGDGTAAIPWKTLGRALGTQWETQSLEPRAHGGDTVLVRPGTYDLPDGRYGTHDQYITVKADGGTVTIRGGVLRSSFIKFEDINFSADTGGGVSIYSHHAWFNNCSYTGYGMIWPETRDEAIRSRNTDDTQSHNVIVENCTVHDGNQGISVIGIGNYIIRNCVVYDQNGDGMKFMGEHVLITGNRIHHVARPGAWTASKNAGPSYDLSTGNTLTFHISSDYGVTFPESFSVDTLTGSANSASDVVMQLNASTVFTGAGFAAQLSEDPYPYPGHVMIYSTNAHETHRFYITGTASDVLNFSDNTRDLNDISSETPAMSSTDHCDYIANDDGDTDNIIIRNNKMWGGQCQGIKMDGIGGVVYKEHIAIVNNQITGSEESARMFYFDYRGSGSPASYIHYNNILIAHNTIMKPATGNVRTQFTIDMDNPYLTYMTIINNIIGNYMTGDWDFDSGTSDYNLFTDDTYASGQGLNDHSLLGDPAFASADYADNWDFSLLVGSEARGNADPSPGIRYDVDWNARSTTAPSIGCYE